MASLDGGGISRRRIRADALVAEFERDRRAEFSTQVRRNRSGRGVAKACPPNRIGEVGVVSAARNHVPMHVRHHVAQARDVHLVGPDDVAHRFFRREHHVHQMAPVVGRKIGGFGDMAIQDDAAEAGVFAVVDQDDAGEIVFVEHVARRAVAEFAGSLHARNDSAAGLRGS